MRVEYNNVTIYNAQTTSWDETVEYDSSGMNMIGNKISLSFEGCVYPDDFNKSKMKGIPHVDPHIKTDNLGYKLANILRQLSMPRGRLKVYDDRNDEVVFFEALPLYEESVEGEAPTHKYTETEKRNVDINGGPKPHSISVSNIVGKFAMINISIEVTKIRCLGGETGAQGDLSKYSPVDGFVVSNRVTTDESLDANFYITRTYNGKLRISSTEKSVHFYRHLFYPPLEDGFRRESVRFSESEDGLMLTYSVTDKQARCSAPYPATAFSGNVDYSIQNSATMSLSVNLSMIGAPYTPKTALVSRAVQAVNAKIQEFMKKGKTNGICKNYAVSENLGDPPSVSVSASYELISSEAIEIGNPEDNDLSKIIAPCVELIGEPLEFEKEMTIDNVIYTYNRIKSPKPNPYGYDIYCVVPEENKEGEDKDEDKDKSNVFGYIKSLATVPCAMRPLVKGEGGGGGTEDVGELVETKVTQDPEGTEYNNVENNVQSDVVEYPYTFYKSDITYYTDYSRLVLPIAPFVKNDESMGEYGSYSVSDLRRLLSEKQSSLYELLNSSTEEDKNNSSADESGNPENSNNTNDTPQETTVSADANVSDTPSDGTGETENPSDEAGNPEEPTEETEVTVESLMRAISAIRNALTRYDSVRVVQYAKPVPKARVIIEAERVGRLPEMPNPDEVVVTSGDNPILFTTISNETRICEPSAAKTGDGIFYSIIGTYEYAMSREYVKGDEVWLLMNPTFGLDRYYPKKVNDKGNKVVDGRALTVLYNGKQLNHLVEEAPSKDDSLPDDKPNDNPTDENPDGNPTEENPSDNPTEENPTESEKT